MKQTKSQLRFSVVVSAEFFARLQKYATKHDRTIASAIRTLCEKAMNAEK